MAGIFSITDFGAECSQQLQTAAIQAAIDACVAAGGGKVTVPAGTFYTGSIRLRSRVTLYLQAGAVLKGSRDPQDYFGYRADTVEPLAAECITDALYTPPTMRMTATYVDSMPEFDFLRVAGSRWNNAIIRAFDADDIAIEGEEGAVIDGSNTYDALGEEHYRGPHAITLFGCTNVRLQGYTVRDSANWAHNLRDCENVCLQNVTVLAGHDGVHFSQCRNVTVRDCAFYTGDDCVAGFANVNVLVENCILNSSCSAMRFGGTNVLVRGCDVYGPGKYLFRGSLSTEEKQQGILLENTGHRNNMLSFFTYYADYSLPVTETPGNILIRDCRVSMADRLLHYNFSSNEPWQRQCPLADITFENITADGIAMPLSLYGAPDAAVNQTMRRCGLSVREGVEPFPLIRACHYRIALEDVAVSGDITALVLARSQGVTALQNVRCALDEASQLQHTDEEFVIQPI